jgi:hypothetical protein
MQPPTCQLANAREPGANPLKEYPKNAASPLQTLKPSPPPALCEGSNRQLLHGLSPMPIPNSQLSS